MMSPVAGARLWRTLNEWFGVAAAEVRTLRRLVRTWVFVALAAGLTGSTFVSLSQYHSFPGGVSRFALLPRFSWTAINNYVLWSFMAAVVFLAFDTRHRDEQSAIHEALDSRPQSNLTLFAARLCGVAFATLTALFAVSVLLQVASTVGGALGWVVYPIEPVAMLTFLFVDAIPALVAWCAVVLLLVAVLGNRLAVAITALALLGLHMWAQAHVPVYLLPAISLLYIHDNWTSDLAPRFADAQTYLHRGSLLLVAGGFLAWTAALSKRADGVSRSTRGLRGALLVVLGVAGIGAVALQCVEDLKLRGTWLAAHERASDIQTPLVRHISGDVSIDPGRELGLDLELQLEAPSHADLPTLVFSFNPGQKINELRVDNTATPFSHEFGLLRVELPEPLAAGSPMTLTLHAAGLPDPDFAYLDSAVDWRERSARNRILELGTAAGIYESRYVALMPAMRWLPVPGANLTDASRGHFPMIDLTVAVPEGWLVGGPGRRESNAGGRFRFRPPASVPQVAIFAGPFERRAIQVAGLEFELLFHPDHLDNLASLADLQERIKARVAELVREAGELGIPYPYNGFALVEVPARLREYGGGWALDTVLELPGLLLVKEQGFPYANFNFNDPAFPSDPESLASLKWDVLNRWFDNSFQIGNAIKTLSRHLTTYQSRAMGPGASTLDAVFEALAESLLDDYRLPSPGIYSNFESDFDDEIGASLPIFRTLTASRRTEFGGFRATLFGYGDSKTWELLLGASISVLEMERDPGAVGARWLRVRAATRSIHDYLGRARTAAFLAALRARHAGAAFDADDFNAAAAEAGIDLQALLGDWLNDAALPGFMASRARVARIADTGGRLRYETRVHVHNGEPVPGVVRVTSGDFGQLTSDAIHIPGNSTVEIGLVSDEPTDHIWLEPYLALNRNPVWIDVVDETQDGNAIVAAPLAGARPSEWTPPDQGIVIDDLDPGFVVEYRDGQQHAQDETGPSVGGRAPELDQGLPINSPTPGAWSRTPYPSSWGRYRQTVASAMAGDGGQIAVFAADLPETGQWRLDFHKPDPQPPGFGYGRSYATLGSYDMSVVADDRATPIPFDGEAAEVGWNKIGEFEFTETEVRLEISSATDGEMVIADAIRWVPLD
ncbi:MAG: hypothetical protein OXK76_17475 [Gammaproteobacteria bacterium]|nr:hypothetical protein [Gammaproteobacteria bacterium]